MKRSNQLTELLATLSPTEKKAFLAFLESPYFNRQRRLYTLADILMQGAEPVLPEAPQLHKLLFGKEEVFRQQAIYDACSQLYRLLERFMSLREFEADEAQHHQYMLTSINRRQAGISYEKNGKRRGATGNHILTGISCFFERQFVLHRQAAEHEAGRQRRDRDQHLVDTVQWLDLSYWSARLKFTCELLSRSHIVSESVPETLLEPIDQWIATLPELYRNEPAIQAYLYIYRALKKPADETRYHDWIAWLNEHTHLLPKTEVADMYSYAQNYCTRKINSGDSGYLQQIFLLFGQRIDKDLILDEQGFLDHRVLKNMVTVGISLQAYEWVDTFLHDYRDKLLPAYRTDAYLFNLASLRHAQGQHAESLSLLSRVEFHDLFYELSARSLMLKLYYEMDEDASLEFLMENFRLYLQRNRDISDFQRPIYQNLLRMTRRLYNLRAQAGILSKDRFEDRLERLSRDIEQAKQVANRSWLRRQVSALHS